MLIYNCMHNTFTTDKATRPSLALLFKASSTAADLLEALSPCFDVCRPVHIITTHHLKPCHITSSHITSHHAMSCHMMPCHVTSYHVMSHDVMSQQSRQCLLTQSRCLYADDTQTGADRIHTCTLGGSGTGISRDQSPTAMAAAEDDTPVA